MSASQKKHVVAYAIPAWGHMRPLITLSASLAKLRPEVHVTILIVDAIFDRGKNELARSFDDGDEETARRVRIASIGNIKLMAPDAEGNFARIWSILMAEQSISCARTGATYPALPKPNAVIIDIFAIFDIDVIKSSDSTHSVKIYALLPGMMSTVLQLFGPEKLGGKGNIRVKAQREAESSGSPYEEVVEKISFGVSDEVVRIPGLPPMYDYENSAQDFPIPDGLAVGVYPRMHEMLESLSGAVLITTNSYEPEAVAATKSWYAETGRHAYLAGPLLPTSSKGTAAVNEKKQSAEADEIQAFLDETLRTSGEKSLLYISFGSHFWPVNNPENLWAFLNVVMELNIPFILSHASPLAAPIPDEIKAKVKAYGKGVTSPWTPQQLILDHPATGWFVAHGGHNGLTEAIVSNVPMIVWPFRADQPMNAVMLSEKHKVAYELREVRTGEGLRPIYRDGFKAAGTLDALKREAKEVLGKAFGEDGKEKRARLADLREAVLGEWKEGGASWKDVNDFLDSL